MLRSVLDIIASALNAVTSVFFRFLNSIDDNFLTFLLSCIATFMVCVIIGRLIHHGGMGLSRSDFDKSNPKREYKGKHEK